MSAPINQSFEPWLPFIFSAGRYCTHHPSTSWTTRLFIPLSGSSSYNRHVKAFLAPLLHRQLLSMDPPTRPVLSIMQENPTSQPSSSRPQGQRNETDATTGTNASQDTGQAPHKKKKHRAGKKRRHRRQSFAAPSEDLPMQPAHDLLNVPGQQGNRPPFYGGGRNLSLTSLESEALLDHRYASSQMW